MTIAERICEIIGEENFLRAEAYYYDYYLDIYSSHDDLKNFCENLEKHKSFYCIFPWLETKEGHIYWSKLHDKIKKELK